jgi:hypothetical protein
MVTDHYLYFGDAAFVRQFVPAADGILEHFARRLDPVLGLVACTDSTFWEFSDWASEWKPMGIPPAGEQTGFLTYTNMLCIYTLHHMADLMRALDRPAVAEEYTLRADALIAAVKTHCFKLGHFTDGLASGALLDRDFSQHGQIWAVLCGAATGDEARSILRNCFMAQPGSSSNDETCPPSSFTKASQAMAFYTLRAASLAGGDVYDEIFHTFWEPWRKQLSQNLSTWCEDMVSYRSDCHAWGSTPLYEFMVEVAGIKPATPGWASVEFQPRVRLFPEFTAKVPLGGRLASWVAQVSWQRRLDFVHVSLSFVAASGGKLVDSAVPVHVVFPDGHTEKLCGSKLTLTFDL